MALLIFLVAVGGSLVLERQEKKHWLELELEYRRAGLEVPKPVPRLSKFEAWANMGLGVTLSLAGGFLVWVTLMVPKIAEGSMALEIVTLILAGGVTLVILGAKALSLYRKSA